MPPDQRPVNDLYNSRRFITVLLATFIAIALLTLGYRTLVPPDEGRYAEMAREMFASGDWITTRLNGIKYFEKPPLQTWFTAATFALFGLGEWQARLFTGLCGIGGVLAVAYAGVRVFGARAGFYAGLTLASSLFWVAGGQIASLDMGLAGMMTLTLCALLLAQRDGAAATTRLRWMLVCWGAMALAVLAKGLVGVVLPGAVLVLYSLLARDLGIWRRLHLGKGLLLFFAIAAPWFILVGRINPEQPRFFFIYEHFYRFLLPTHHREGVWYYFIALLLPGVMPWLGVLPQALLAAWRRQAGATFQPRLLLLIWALFLLAFFSYSSSKLPGYIMPVFPALALLIGVYLEQAPRAGRIVTAALLLLVGVAGLVALPQLAHVAMRYPQDRALLLAYQPWILAAALIAAGGGALSILHARQLRRDWSVLTLAVAGFAATQLLLAGFEPYGNMRAGKDVALKLRGELQANTVVYAVGGYEQAMTFYLGHSVVLVSYLDEFAFGLEQEPQLWVRDIAEFERRWRAHADAGIKDLAIMDLAQYRARKSAGLPMRVVAEDTRRVAVANL